MEIIYSGSPFTFGYPAFDQNAGLFVRAQVYDVSTGSAVFTATANLTFRATGMYTGNYTGTAAKTYLVISLVYTDGTYATIDTNYGPEADCFKSADAPAEFFPFNYGAFDQAASLFIQAAVYNSAALVTTTALAYVFGGVYFGSFTGVLNNSYAVVNAVYTDGTYAMVDLNRAPGVASFRFFSAVISQIVQSATLTVLSTVPPLPGKLIFTCTQGDIITFGLTAVLNGQPYNLTGAVLTTYFRSTNGVAYAISNSQHTINPDQNNFRGQFNVSLLQVDTEAIPVGENKEIITEVVQGASTIYFHGNGLVSVLSPIPIQ